MELSVQADCLLWGNEIIVSLARQSRVFDVLNDGHKGMDLLHEGNYKKFDMFALIR